MKSPAPSLEHRVLVSMPGERDTERTVDLLAEANLPCTPCSNWLVLCEELRKGAGAVLVTDEILASDVNRQLESALREQPTWSALPVLVLAREGSTRLQEGPLSSYGGAVILERPVRTRSLVSAVQSALRGRRNQYQIREALREHERQAREIKQQDEKLRFALLAGRLGSWELDIQTKEFTCSEICKANYGRPLDRPFSYQELLESIHPDDRGRVRAAVASGMEGNPYDVEYRVIWPNGEIHGVLARGRAVYGAHNKPVQLIGVSMDITERNQMNEALQRSQAELAAQADQLRIADRRKDEFLATLAHELRNPLAPISTGLSLLGNAKDPATSDRTLAVMQRQVRHMVRLIDDLLDVSRITTGKLVLKRERLSVASAIEAAVEGSSSLLQQSGHQLRLDIPSEPLFIDADHTRIAQVISNLLNNAAKYTPNGGTIELSLRRDGNRVKIAVQDNGLGIPREHLDDIFEMFGQVNRALDRSHGGLGIGLALVRKLVEMHGGTVDAQSEGLNLGSTFTVTLPLAEQPVADSPRTAPHQEQHIGDRRVLVVDDNEDAAEMLALMLEQEGYATAVAHDGYQAIETAHAVSPDVVILDIGLPGISGYAIAEQMRADRRLASMGLIALTGWGSPEDRRRALAAGFDVHLTKPVSAEDLHEALERVGRRQERVATTV